MACRARVLRSRNAVFCVRALALSPRRAHDARAMNPTHAKMPTVYLPHGGGPWPFMETTPFADARETGALAAYLRALATHLPRRPKALVVVSAHWEQPVPTVMTSEHPP